jgi:type IV pilus assembly protein PilN
MQFTINLATKTYINQKKLTYALAAGIIFLLFCLILNLSIFAFNAGEITRLKKLQAASEAKQQTPKRTVSQKEYEKLLASIKLANGLIEKKAFNWIGFLDRLESVVPEGVMLTSVDPGVKEQTLKLTGAVVNFKNLKRFMENLEESNSFSEVFLLDQKELKAAEDQTGTSFTITCRFTL